MQRVTANGKIYPDTNPHSDAVSAEWHAANPDNGFASSLTGSNIICHNAAVPGGKHIEVSAGSTLTLTWNTWPESHKGPMLNYLALCTVQRALQRDSQGEPALHQDRRGWLDFGLIRGIGPATACLLRHSAGREGGAQAYSQRLNLKVMGSKSNASNGGTAGTALYSPTDPGILVDIRRRWLGMIS